MRWEYKIEPVSEKALKELGSDGWELVSVSSATLYFKRPVEPKPPDILIVNVSDRDIDDIAQQIKEAMANRA